jgi:hypothetical protein
MATRVPRKTGKMAGNRFLALAWEMMDLSRVTVKPEALQMHLLMIRPGEATVSKGRSGEDKAARRMTLRRR